MRAGAGRLVQCVLPGDVAGELGEQMDGVALQGAGDPDELHHVETPLAGLHLGDPRGVDPQPGREVALAQPGPLAGLDEQGDEPPIGGGVDALLDRYCRDSGSALPCSQNGSGFA